MTVRIFDEQKPQYEQLSLFSSDRPISPEEVNAVTMVLTEMRLLRPHSFGDCRLGWMLWEELGLSAYWDARLGGQRGRVPTRLVACWLDHVVHWVVVSRFWLWRMVFIAATMCSRWVMAFRGCGC